MKKNRTTKMLAILLAVLLATLALPTAAFAENGDDDGYDDGDVAAIRAIINASDKLKEEYDVDAPDTWADRGLVDWNEETPRRVAILTLQFTNDAGELTGVTDFSETLDASALTALKTLFCSDNTGLTELILPRTENLLRLSCYNTSITELDISGCPALEYLDCYNTDITALDVSNNTDLTYLDCEGTNVSSLELSQLSKLADLYCVGTNITSLDVSGNPELTYLNCENTGITVLDLSANQSLTEISCPKSLTQLVAPGGYRITMTQTSRGTITLSRKNDNGNPVYTLKALADPSYEFIRWNGVTDFIDGTTENDAEVKFNITGNMDISADFQEERLTLSSLAVEGATLAPAFSKNVFNYTAEVSYDVTSVNIVAQGQSGYTHKITGTGAHELNVGENTFIVTVIVPEIPDMSDINVAEETITQEYVITVTRQAESEPTSETGTNDIHQAGDDSNIGLWIGLAVGILVAGAACAVIWHKKRTKSN